MLPYIGYNIGELVQLYMLVGKERMQQEIWFQKYRILGLLGSGGTARVYLAEHIKLKSYRAIKCISKNHPLYELLRNEAFILKNLKHSCIPIIYDIEEDEESSYIVEQYLEGVTLKDYISTNGSMNEEKVLHFGLQLCDLVQYLHSVERPILYVDLKPENIILSGKNLKLIDFGSALYLDQLSLNQRYTGTRGYAAPELYGHGRVDERCDVYGIGMLLYYMASGQATYDSQNRLTSIDLAGNCSKRLKNMISHCLRYQPAQRYQTVNRLRKELSATKQKNQFKLEAGKTMIYAVAGAQPGIGVTHFALRLSAYFIAKGYQLLYQEMNDSGCVHSIKCRYEDVICSNGLYELHGIPMLEYRKELPELPANYQVHILDYGCLTKDNLQHFLEAQVKLVILGAKDWELENSENILNMIAEYKDITYLFNFLDGKQFRKVIKSMNFRSCSRIPYEPDPYAKVSKKNGLELFDDLTCPRKKLTWWEKVRLNAGGKHEVKTDAFS